MDALLSSEIPTTSYYTTQRCIPEAGELSDSKLLIIPGPVQLQGIEM
jgi:hypothetical protein